MKFYMGVDVGGTFTDATVTDEGGNIYMFKTPTVPATPSQGFLNCAQKAADFFGLSLGDFLGKLEKLAYGTTIATNMLLEGKTACTGLVTTKGFRDTLPIARIGRDRLGLDLQCERPPSLTPRSLIEEVSERVDYAGKIITPLDEADVEKALRKLVKKKVEAIAVCLLWSFKNPAHEERIGTILRKKLPQTYVSLSSEVAPLSGEYERTATVVMNASLGPPVKAHLSQLVQDLKERGLKIPLLIMQSTGGVIPAEDAAAKPVTLVNSGPAGGLIASKYISELMGLKNAICIDMGGTSFDASLITREEYSASLVSRACNHDIFVPMLDIHSIGAGGGSIAWLDMGQRLKVGPQSAGALPGPACYSRRGGEPTVTDADVVLGRINPEYFLGGEMPLDKKKAEKAILEKVAKPLGFDLLKAAAGICRIVDSNMAGAIRAITIQKGYDPRDYALIAFGGAGPTHCASLARELGIGTVVIPFLATVQSAFGIAASDILHSLSWSSATELKEVEKINFHLEKLKATGYSLLRQEGVLESAIEMKAFADMRYKMQSHEVTLPLPARPLTGRDLEQLLETFNQRYEEIYGAGTAFPRAGVEIVTFRVEAIGKIKKPALKAHPPAGEDASAALKSRRQVFFEDSFLSTLVYDGDKLQPGNLLPGPAIVEYKGTTAAIYPDQVGQIDPFLNLILSRKDKRW